MEDRQRKLLESMLKYSTTANNTSSLTQNGSGAQNIETPPKVLPQSKPPKTQTPKKLPAPVLESPAHFSGSAFLSSPEPSSLPLPVFEGDVQVASKGIAEKLAKNSNEHISYAAKTKQNQSAKGDKSELLKKFLKVRKTDGL